MQIKINYSILQKITTQGHCEERKRRSNLIPPLPRLLRFVRNDRKSCAMIYAVNYSFNDSSFFAPSEQILAALLQMNLFNSSPLFLPLAKLEYTNQSI
jgi:hypothetical protein